MYHKKIIVALDSNNFDKTLNLVKKINKHVFGFKVGYEFFYTFGITGYEKIRSICPRIFLDLKLHDIPNTVRNGVKAINKLKPYLTTIHISGGDEMMKSSMLKNKKTKILGVTILTSLDNKQTKKYYNINNISLIIKKFVKQAKKNNLDGVVCSPHEIEIIRKIVGKKFLIVTPGIRPENNKVNNDDQKRTMTPKVAIEKGADLLVIGRPITRSKNPIKVIQDINRSIQ